MVAFCVPAADEVTEVALPLLLRAAMAAAVVVPPGVTCVAAGTAAVVVPPGTTWVRAPVTVAKAVEATPPAHVVVGTRVTVAEG